MTKCHACGSEDVQRSRNDVGFFKSDGIKPVRIYPWRCNACGYVAHYAKTAEQEAADVQADD